MKLVSRPERESRIARAIEASSKSENFDFLRDEPIDLPVIRIPIDLPVYRMANFRTFSDQAQYLAKESKASDFFRTGQENESAQQVQHQILARLASKGVADSVTPVIEVLAKEGQRERILITRRGVVVNGNRRLAAMRELHSGESPVQEFSHVNCQVLPADTSAEDILDIEGVLQARPETRLDYDWIGDAELLAAMLKVKGTPEAVALKLGRKVAEVKNALIALNEANIYLKDWAHADGEYNRVAEDGEQLFKDLPKLMAGKPPALQDASRAVAWSLYDNRKKLEGRLYSYNVAFGKRVEDVLEQLTDETGVAATEESPKEEDAFDFDLDDESATSYRPIINLLKDPTTKDQAVDKLIEICNVVVGSEKDKKSGNAALKAVATANSKLAEVDLSRAGSNTYESIESQLNSIVLRTQSLLGTIKKLRSKPVKAETDESN